MLEWISGMVLVKIYNSIEKKTRWDNPEYEYLISSADRRLAEYQAEENAKREARVNEYTAFFKKKQAQITQLEKEKNVCKDVVRKNNSVSIQDKKLGIVTALITYLERGQADTIKEALNLYDAKRERAENEAARWQMQSFYEQQRLNEQRRAMAKIAEEQEDHNRRIREAQARRDEKIDDAIREMKEKLREE